ncbi:MAG: sigma-54-dependent Fis family transcriptional regulator [FCB group bacterium]|nr:sigma-54-dependent Fis family transcriptional regulator [FCB group bacterium]
MFNIYVVDDDDQIRQSLNEFLTLEGYEVKTFQSGEEVLSAIDLAAPDVILLDLILPGMGGLDILKEVRKSSPDTMVIMITGHADVSSSVEAMKLGAMDYIKKPFDLEEIRLCILKAEKSKSKDEQLAYLKRENMRGFDEFIGNSAQIKSVFKFIKTVADSPQTSVLITGETGTGKELVAKAIHYNSIRADKPLIELNCSAFQENLLESELFGYEPGAFTGARKRKKGLIELAQGGTLFLDEVGDMSLNLQSKLLKVIEEKKLYRLGGVKEISVDVRILSATSSDLMASIAKGQFRQDLLYRLNVTSIELPPLRDRGDDVIQLAEFFLSNFASEFKRHITGINIEGKSKLLLHHWPGNVRELKNVIERAVLFETKSELGPESISIFKNISAQVNREDPTDMKSPIINIPQSGISLEQVEKGLIIKALEIAHGNKTKAAQLLNISRDKMRYKIKKMKIRN